MTLLRRVRLDDVKRSRRSAVDAATLAQAARIVEDVRGSGESALRAHAERLGDLEPGATLLLGRREMAAALEAIEPRVRADLEACAANITAFARAQRESLGECRVAVPGSEAGHRWAAVERAGCYAPGGRHPLPSSVLMTVCTARAAGVRDVLAASPRPPLATLAAAAIAGADAFLVVGGAQAVAAMAYGAGPVGACDVIVGPGNRWVTAAKKLVAGDVGIDMLAGPSELLVLADETADARLVAADLLAQAEHDDDAVPMLAATVFAVVERVEAELERQLAALPTAATARNALRNGFAIVVDGVGGLVRAADAIAAEHLEVMTRDAAAVAERCRHYGGVFIGAGAAEVLGDYGVGPNHVLPTGGVARFSAGLSVVHFLRAQTFLRVDDVAAARGAYERTAKVARVEGLEAHARAAEARLSCPKAWAG